MKSLNVLMYLVETNKDMTVKDKVEFLNSLFNDACGDKGFKINLSFAIDEYANDNGVCYLCGSEVTYDCENGCYICHNVKCDNC